MRLLILLLLAPFILGAATCTKPIPDWNGKLWVANPDNDAIERAQDPIDPQISCRDERIRGFICLSGDDFQRFVDTYIMGCKEWKAGFKLEQAYKVQKKALGE